MNYPSKGTIELSRIVEDKHIEFDMFSGDRLILDFKLDLQQAKKLRDQLSRLIIEIEHNE